MILSWSFINIKKHPTCIIEITESPWMGFQTWTSKLVIKWCHDTPWFQISDVWKKYQGVRNPHFI